MILKSRMDITPEFADDILKKHNKHNYRRYQPAYAKFLGKKMKKGYWQRTEQPIVFDTEGNLKDGQHRLGGVVESGITLYDWPIAIVAPDVTVFDNNRTRTWTEFTRAENSGRAVNTTISGALSLFIGGQNREKVSHEEKLDYYRHHEEDLDKALLFVQRGSNHGLLKKSGCLLAVYCAIRLGAADCNMLEQFCVIANSGFPVDGVACEAPLALKRTIEQNKVSGGTELAIFTFDVTWQAIAAFKRGLRSKRNFAQKNILDEVLQKVKEIDEKEQEGKQ